MSSKILKVHPLRPDKDRLSSIDGPLGKCGLRNILQNSSFFLFEERPRRPDATFFGRRKKLPILAGLAVGLLANTAFSATWYVTQSGAGSKNGTSAANAWPVASFNSSVTPTGGDTVSFLGTFTSQISPSSHGTSASHLTLNFTGATLSAAILLKTATYLTVNGGTFATSAAGGPDGGLIDFVSGNSHDVTINGWQYAGPTNGTVDFCDVWNQGFCYNLTVSNQHVDNIEHFVAGQSTLNHDMLIENNWVRSSTNTVAQTDIITVSDAPNVTIQGNKLMHQTPGDYSSGRHNDCIQTYQKGGANAAAPTNWIVRYNWIELDVNSGDGSNSFMMIEQMGGNPAMQLYGNVFVGAGSISNNGACFDANGGNAVFYCYNNTLIRHSCPDNTIRFLSPGTIYFRNNVMESDPNISGTWVVLSMNAGSAADYNFLYHSGALGAGPHGSTSANPNFINYAGGNFALTTGSPLIGKGDGTIGAQYKQGIASGATWPNPKLATRSAWDVGAFVYSAAAAATPTPAKPTPTPTPGKPTPTPTPTPAHTSSLFSASTAPANVTHESTPLVLGVKFQTSVAGTITGIRFYKCPQNTGTHVATLWNTAGTLLATANFTGETASGWQQVKFAKAVTLAPKTTYIAAYSTGGYYTANNNYFTSAVASGSLTAPAGGNGVYAYGSPSSYPAYSYQSSNYWVDVVFQLP